MSIALRLPYRPPLDADGLLGFFRMRAVAGVEEMTEHGYRRSLRLAHGDGVVELVPADGHVSARFWLDDLRDLGAAVQRCRTLLDLDADPGAVADALGRDALIGELVRAVPGRRVPGNVDGAELAVRAVLGQQVSLRGAATLAGALVQGIGRPLARPVGDVTHVFPVAEAIAAVDPARLPMPRPRRTALIGLAAALAGGDIALDPGADRADTQRRLLALPGIGPWTVSYVAMRALRDPDAFLPTDLGIKRAVERLGHDPSPRAVERLAERWRPYRAYAAQHLWAELGGPSTPAVPITA